MPKTLAKLPRTGAGHSPEGAEQTLECCPCMSSRDLCPRVLSHPCVQERGRVLARNQNAVRWPLVFIQGFTGRPRGALWQRRMPDVLARGHGRC